jgi:hypothetical protein
MMPMTMTIVLRNISDRTLLASQDEERWTRDPKEAVAFRRSHDAVKTAARMNLDLSEIELVFHFGPTHDMVVRLNEHGSRVVQA